MDAELESRQIRAARNQSLYREVNERVRSLNRGWAPEPGAIDFVCECADEGCALPLRLTLEEYERVRADDACFVVAGGHVYPEVEDVVGGGEEYVVVRKVGAGAAIAEATSRRRRA